MIILHSDFFKTVSEEVRMGDMLNESHGFAYGRD